MQKLTPEAQARLDALPQIGTLTDLFEKVPDEEAALRFLFDLRYGQEGWTCPRCGARSRSLLVSRRKAQCPRCSKQEAVTRGTPLYRSKMPVRSWLLVHYLVANDKRGVSATAVAHELRCQWNTAYYMLQRVRSACAREAAQVVLAGEVEVDDAYIGSKGQVRGRGTRKAPFIAAAERRRGGGLAIRAVGDCSGASYRAFARDHVGRAARVRSDDWSGTAAGLKGWPGLEQRKFDASDDDARLPLAHHVISNFKAHVVGTYHGVRQAYPQSYMDEFSWRYNHRGNRCKTALLLRDTCCCGKAPRSSMPLVFAPQPGRDELVEAEKRIEHVA